MQGGLAQVVERSIRIRQAPGWRPGYSNWLFFTIIFIANFNASLLCQTEKVEEQKQCPRGISSSGRALDSHSRGTGIETRILQLVILYNYFHCQFQRKFVVPNRKVWRKETKYKRDQLKWQSARFAFEAPDYPDSPISFSLQLFSLPIAEKRLENRTNMQGDQLKWQSARFAFDRHRDRDPDTPIGYSLQLFSLPISTQVCCAKQKRLENRNKCPRGISSSGRALDSHSRGTGIETRILQLVNLYNYFHCQFQRKFFVPNRKGWRIEQICKGDQLKWQSARFAFERHRDGDPDTPIGYSLQ